MTLSHLEEHAADVVAGGAGDGGEAGGDIGHIEDAKEGEDEGFLVIDHFRLRNFEGTAGDRRHALQEEFVPCAAAGYEDALPGDGHLSQLDGAVLVEGPEDIGKRHGR